jgi:hypothetical protein
MEWRHDAETKALNKASAAEITKALVVQERELEMESFSREAEVKARKEQSMLNSLLDSVQIQDQTVKADKKKKRLNAVYEEICRREDERTFVIECIADLVQQEEILLAVSNLPLAAEHWQIPKSCHDSSNPKHCWKERYQRRRIQSCTSQTTCRWGKWEREDRKSQACFPHEGYKSRRET